MNKKLLFYVGIVLIVSLAAQAATLRGTIYNAQLNPEKDTLLEIDTQPAQKYLAKDGTYSINILPGKYTLTIRKELTEISQPIDITQEGEYNLDLFLIPDLQDESDLWDETTQKDLIVEPLEDNPTPALWRYIVTGLIIIALLIRIIYMRKKYGSITVFRKHIKAEAKKTIEQHKQELEKEPAYIEKALAIIKSHDDRITQKELRTEMLYLSEAKVSLIITELEHKGVVEKIKKGRGNVIILKQK